MFIRNGDMLKRHKQMFKLGRTEKSFTKDSTILSVDVRPG